MLKPAVQSCRQSVDTFCQKVAGSALAFGMQQMLNTLRVKVATYDKTADIARLDYNEHCIYVFWHENIGVMIPQWGNCPFTMLLSQHRDADWLRHTAQYFRLHYVRGSSSRGGSAAIRKLKKLGTKTSIAITPDGPRGPRRIMAMGPIFLASRLGMPVIPVGVGYQNPIRLNTWDRFAIPKPLTRTRVLIGPKIRIPEGIKRDSLEHHRSSIEKLLNDLNDFAETWATQNWKVANEYAFCQERRGLELKFDRPTSSMDRDEPESRRAA